LKVLLIDNFDSFTYNIAHYLEQMDGVDLSVIRYDEWIANMHPNFDKLLISPGPGLASDYPGLLDTVLKYGNEKPILGICLGMQCAGLAFGADLVNLGDVWHGRMKTCKIEKQHFLLKNLPQTFTSGHYHSWVLSPKNFPDSLQILATETETGAIMAIAHQTLPVYGVQFHPESVMTPHGFQILTNFILNR
jgi:anthranilate synthase/aminodeoxychorismate synthase-like glutamine amidotransferase